MVDKKTRDIAYSSELKKRDAGGIPYFGAGDAVDKTMKQIQIGEDIKKAGLAKYQKQMAYSKGSSSFHPDKSAKITVAKTKK